VCAAVISSVDRRQKASFIKIGVALGSGPAIEGSQAWRCKKRLNILVWFGFYFGLVWFLRQDLTK
jgi:hypothetical protein